MKYIFITSVVVLSLALSSISAEAATKVFLLGGQSNMAGAGAYPGGIINGAYVPPEPAIPAPYNVLQTEVKFWYNGSWINLQSGYGYQPGEFGPEVTFGYTLNNLFPNDDIYLVKYAESGSNLAVNWNPNGTGTQYNNFKSTVNSAINNLNTNHLDPVVTGMIWMQGESDTTVHAYAAAYATNLKNLITTVRSDFSART